MPQLLTRPFTSDAFVTLGHCHAWKAGLVWVQVVSDLLIALGTTSVLLALLQLLRKRKDIPFKAISLSFAIFLVACAATNGMEVWALWRPGYWFSVVIKVLAAVLSVTTALWLTRLLPAALAHLTWPDDGRLRDSLRKSVGTSARVGETGQSAASDAARKAQTGTPALYETALGSRDHGHGSGMTVGYGAGGGTVAYGAGYGTTGHGSELSSRNVPWNDPVNLQSDRVFAYCRSELIDHSSTPLLAERAQRGQDNLGAQRRHETNAAFMAERLATAIDSIQDAFAVFDRADRLVLCNSAYRALIGDRLEGSLVGKPYEELLQAWSQDLAFAEPAAREHFRQERLATRSQDARTVFHVHTCDGRSLRAVDRKTPEGGFVTTVSDLSADERRAEEVRAACNAAEEARAAKSAFLSSMSHELRTPLNAILGFAQLLRGDSKEPLSERHKERIDRILSGGEQLSRLIDDVLDLSRIESGGAPLSIEPVNLVDILEEAKAALAPEATKSGIAIEVELPAQTPWVNADRIRVAQILLNFGSNSVKYNRPAGKVTFVVSTPAPEVVRVLVHDTGIGIPAEMQRKIFQPFQRAGQEMGPVQGTGIGLVIARRLALLMEGNVDFRSVAGEGSDFWVDLPKHSSVLRESAPPTTHPQDTAGLALRMPKVVLYVEDNPANVMFMEDLASTLENVELVSAPTAEVGVDVARRRRPQVVIMDINLPGMNGIEALRTLRSAPETRDVPVIALTAAASQRDRERGVQAGFHRYLTKPVKVTELVTTLEALFAPTSGDGRWSGAATVAVSSDPHSPS